MTLPVLASILQLIAATQTTEIHAVRRPDRIVIDGRNDDAGWRVRSTRLDLRQRDPNEGQPGTFTTDVKVVYDDVALYISAALTDDAPDRIHATLARRDANVPNDAFTIYIDPESGGRTGFFFTIGAGGTLRDGTLSNDEWEDASWDGVWEGKAAVVSNGWVMEARIPWSQIGYNASNMRINFKREIIRSGEVSFVAFTPKNGSGFVSRFVPLVGIADVRSSAPLELRPYVTLIGGAATSSGIGLGPRFNTGLDVRARIGTSVSAIATANADFGQAEVDPAVINLSDSETFFAEKRAFFLEGGSHFVFGRGGATSYSSFNWGDPNFFYSRRIGRAPQGRIDTSSNAYVPTGARVLGAVKAIGTINSDWKFAALSSVTASEHALVHLQDEVTQFEVEPAAAYTVVRLNKQKPGSISGVGLIATHAQRFFGDETLKDQVSTSASALGIDGWRYFGGGNSWAVSGWIGATHVRGNEARIAALQMSSVRYYQRPDRTSGGVDSTATSMDGLAARLSVNKQTGNVLFNSAVGFITPGFDPNDLGYLSRADIINAHVSSGYRWVQPGWLGRSGRVSVAGFRSYNFDGDVTWQGVFGSANLTTRNYLQLRSLVVYNGPSISVTRSRGGPAVANPSGVDADIGFATDSRKKFVIDVGAARGWGRAANYQSVSAKVEVKPRPSAVISTTVRVAHDQSAAHYVGMFADSTATQTYDHRYIFAELDQRSVGVQVRVDWTLSQVLSLQLYAQPLVSRIGYGNYKSLTRARDFEFARYAGSDLTLPASEQEIAALRGNAVVRWEFRPGSALFFVWTQRRQALDTGLDNTSPSNAFMIKATWWWTP